MIRILLAALAMATLGAVPALAVTFDHAAHNTYLDEVDCALCHVEYAPSIVPDQGVCLECHDKDFVNEVEMPGLKTHGPVWALNHRPFAKGNTIDCYACHQQWSCLECHKSGFADEQGDFNNNMINVHRSDFQVSHPIAARTDPQLCSSCHEPQFCSDCHNDFAPEDLAIKSHRRGFSDLPAGTGNAAHATFTEAQCAECHPNSVVIGGSWSASHAREARKNLATCQACHPEGDICLTCHSATSGLKINPHPRDWDDISGRLERASDGRTCRKCH